MKKFNFIIAALVIAIGFAACSKDDTEYYDPQKYLTLEAPILENYVNTTAGLENAIMDEITGIWYVIEEEGLQDSTVGVAGGYYKYNINNDNQIEAPQIRVNYVGKLVSDGSTFEQNNMKAGDYLSLGEVVLGWRPAFLPIEIEDKQGEFHEVGGFTELGLQKGAKIRIVMPSPYGYANSIRPKIPANSPLDFYIEVLEVKAPTPPTNK